MTDEQAIEFGMTLQKPLESIQRCEEINRLHGDTAASLYRVSALQKFRKAVSVDEIRALIIAAAGDGYEVEESSNFKVPDEAKLEGAVRAMQKGDLLSDEAGPHFTVIVGKGGVSVLIKEAGHRHKLKRKGCKNIDVVAAARGVRQRPNAAGKFDMIVDGRASCDLNGERIEVQRTGEFAMLLPCYESDGPDGHEAKARRRLLRDLWAKVSGEFEAIEIDEANESFVEVDTAPAAKIENQMTDLQRDRKVAEDSLHRAFEMVAHDAEHSTFVRQSIEGINEADSIERLKEVGERMAGERKRLKISEKVMEFLRRLYLVREREIGGKE